MTWILAAASLLGGVAAGLYLWEKVRARRRQSAIPVTERLLRYLWVYPTLGESESSWASKESAALLGKLGKAREEPGLGVAIITTELALLAFGRAADGRIAQCINWGLSRTQSEPPYLILTEVVDARTSAIELKPDFRHTLALAVVIARSRKHFSRYRCYVELTVEQQLADGGWPAWPAGSGQTISEVFTVIYATELMHLASQDDRTPAEDRQRAETARNRAIEWLVDNRGPQGLWSTGVLSDYDWDGLLGTAWVAHRLGHLAGSAPRSLWASTLSSAIGAVARGALARETWRDANANQRQRVEARIAAAVARALAAGYLEPEVAELAAGYLTAWREAAVAWIGNLRDHALDPGTVAFTLEAAVAHSDLGDSGRRIAEEQLTGLQL